MLKFPDKQAAWSSLMTKRLVLCFLRLQIGNAEAFGQGKYHFVTDSKIPLFFQYFWLFLRKWLYFFLQ